MASSHGQPTPLKRKFIVLHKLMGKALVDEPTAEAKCQVFPGELFEELFTVDERSGHEQLSLMSIDRKDVIIECSIKDLCEVGSYGANLLLPIKKYERRLPLLEKNRLEEALSYEYGSFVSLDLMEMPYPGIIRFVGILRGRGEGVYFGVELPHHVGHGDSDGSIDGYYYFRCENNAAVFATIDQLHPRSASPTKVDQNDLMDGGNDMLRRGMVYENSNVQQRNSPQFQSEKERSQFQSEKERPKTPNNYPSNNIRSSPSNSSNASKIYPFLPVGNSSHISKANFGPTVNAEIKKGEEVLSRGTGYQNQDIRQPQSLRPVSNEAKYLPFASAAGIEETLPFRLNDRVYYLVDDRRHVGCVRWIGRIFKDDNEVYYGIELDEPVGKGTGLISGHQLFVTRPNHASFANSYGLAKVETAAELFPRYSSDQQTNVMGERKTSWSDVVKTPAVQQTHYTIPDRRNDQHEQRSRQTTKYPDRRNDEQQSRIAMTFPAASKNERNIPIKMSTSYDQLHQFQAGKQVSPKSPEKSRHIQIEETVQKKKVSKQQSRSPDYRNEQKSFAFDTSQPSNIRTLITDALNVHPDKSPSPLPPIRTIDVPSYQSVYSKQNGFAEPSAPSYRSEAISTKRKSIKQQNVTEIRLSKLDGNTDFGKKRGIQGHKNSCYLDATLFGMFAFSNVFDEILYRDRRRGDVHGLEEVQGVLRDEIVRPLRNTLYVPCENVMKLRELMNSYGQVSGITDQEKDPEEFLSSLLEQILKIDPLLKLTSSDANWYTLFVEKNFNTPVPTVQELFDQSLVTSDVRLKEAPKCLILQTPRSGAQYKMYRLILPSPMIDITDAIMGQARCCCICEDSVATLECKDCFGWMKAANVSNLSSLSSMAYCSTCYTQRHKKALQGHKAPVDLKVTAQGTSSGERVMMELFAVLCIKTSHYVTFAKDGDGMWYFVDSMADREGEASGFNIPEVRPCPEVLEYLDAENGRKLLLEHLESNERLEEPINRFFEDCYLCMYQPKAKDPNNNIPSSMINTSSEV